MVDRGPVAVLFTDIEGSTRLWEDHPGVMARVVGEHDRILRGAIDARGGRVFSTAGDSFAAAFGAVPDAVSAAVDAQSALGSLSVEGVPVRVRMAVDCGVLEERDGALFGRELNRCGRLRDAAHGGQVLVSEPAAGLAADRLPPTVSLRDLGVHRLRDLSQPLRVFQVCHPDVEEVFPPVRSLGGLSASLPVQVTSFVGRVEESAELAGLVDESRLVTVVGAGGCGKSRLAVQVAADLVDAFPDGVCLVELASLADPELVAATVAGAVGLREQPGRDMAEVLAGYLRSMSLLLVIDNCEGLIEPVAGLVAHLLAHTSDVAVLATSREPLHIHGETVFHLAPLPVPAPGEDAVGILEADAVQLYGDRASAARPGFEVTGETAQTVADICTRLDGIPLAIELAASMVRVLAPDEIARRLDDRFRLLTAGARDDLSHHRTLEAAIDWSFQLLPADLQGLFVRLAIFAGSFTLDAAEDVCGGPVASEVVAGVVQLADRSLLEIVETGTGARYLILETVRAFASDRLHELPATVQQDLAERHFRYALSMAEHAEEGPIRVEDTWPAEVDSIVLDLRRALSWAIATGHDEGAVGLAGALGFYWLLRGRHAEAVRWYRTVPLHSEMVTVDSRIRAFRWAALFLCGVGTGKAVDVRGGYELGVEALQLARQRGDPGEIAACLHTAALSSDPVVAIEVLGEGLELARTAGDRWREATICLSLALCHLDLLGRDRASTARAKGILEESLELLRDTGDDRGRGFALGWLGRIAIVQDGDAAAARSLGQKALRIGRQLSTPGLTGNALQLLGLASYLTGDLDAAMSYHREAADHAWRSNGNEDMDALGCIASVAYAKADYPSARKHLRRLFELRTSQPFDWEELRLRRALWDLGRVLACDGGYREAAVLFAAVQALATELGLPWYVHSGEPDDYRRCVSRVEGALTSPELEEARARGRAMTLEQAAEFASGLLGESDGDVSAIRPTAKDGRVGEGAG